MVRGVPERRHKERGCRAGVAAGMTITEKLLRTDLEVLEHGGQEAISLFLEISKRLHEAGEAEALRQWIVIAAPALPERERAEVMTLLMYGYLYMSYQTKPPNQSGARETLH
jgi:hypothetical protein